MRAGVGWLIAALLRRSRIAIVVLVLLAIPATLYASSASSARHRLHYRVFYIDYAHGSNSNSGRSTSRAWKTLPGMVSFTGRYHHRPGDHFIFKGGVTWPASVFPLAITQGGTPGHADYYGVIRSWHTGSRWTRPIFDGTGGPAHTGGSCSESRDVPDGTGHSVALDTIDSPPFVIVDVNYVTLDGFNMMNLYWGCSGSGYEVYYIHAGGAHITIDDVYLHDWHHAPAPAAADDLELVYGGAQPGDLFENSVCDGRPAADSGECSHMISRHDVAEYLPNAFLPANASYCEVSRSSIGPIVRSFSGSHANGIETLAACNRGRYFDNVIHNTLGETLFVGNPGRNSYIYNNVIYASEPVPIQIDCRDDGDENAYIYNNTVIAAVGSAVDEAGGRCGTVDIRNNQFIRTGRTNGIDASRGRLIAGHNCSESMRAAQLQGYTATDLWAPRSARGCTVGRGENLSGLRLFSTDIVGRRRPRGRAAWDAGAYQFFPGRRPSYPIG